MFQTKRNPFIHAQQEMSRAPPAKEPSLLRSTLTRPGRFFSVEMECCLFTSSDWSNWSRMRTFSCSVWQNIRNCPFPFMAFWKAEMWFERKHDVSCDHLIAPILQIILIIWLHFTVALKALWSLFWFSIDDLFGKVWDKLCFRVNEHRLWV